jgi:hypothetical protein
VFRARRGYRTNEERAAAGARAAGPQPSSSAVLKTCNYFDNYFSKN